MDICFVNLGPWNIGNNRLLTTDHWQDHGIGLLRTILKNSKIKTCVYSTKNYVDAKALVEDIYLHSKIIMNIRTYNYHVAKEIAQLYKSRNPDGLVMVGGMHPSVDLKGTEDIKEFDKICVGDGLRIITDLVQSPERFPRIIHSNQKTRMEDYPWIDRKLWPKLNSLHFEWPLENNLKEWGGGRMVSLLTSRVCPWRCSFCNEASYIENQPRRPVDDVIAELNHIYKEVSEFDFVVIHDSMFFQQPSWLEEFLEKYVTNTIKPWPFWAAARADTVRRWPDLFKRLVVKANWKIVSIGLESGSDKTLKTLNKECTVTDNLYAIQLINQIGDFQQANGINPVKLFSNIMWGVPGEDRDDILDTARMSKIIKRPLLSNSLFSPYPGGALGNQIIAEGQSLLNEANNNRDPNADKMVGIDYAFVKQAMTGKLDQLVSKSLNDYILKHTINGNIDSLNGSRKASKFYILKFENGQNKLSWGASLDEAIENNNRRLGIVDSSNLKIVDHKSIPQNDLQNVKLDLS